MPIHKTELVVGDRFNSHVRQARFIATIRRARKDQDYSAFLSVVGLRSDSAVCANQENFSRLPNSL